MSRLKIFKISDEEIKRLYLSGKSLRDIAKIAQDTKGLTPLKKRLNKMGIDTSYSEKRKEMYGGKLSKAFKKYQLDETVFDIIDSDEKAYWLGWYMTDGYNNENKHSVSLRLQEKDTEILEKLKHFLKTDSPILKLKRKYKGKEVIYSELYISSIHLSKSLANLGVIQNKTHKKSIPNIDSKYIRAFIRGYFDGDGCISIVKNKNKKVESYNYQLNFTGNIEPLVFIKEYFEKQINLNDRKIHLNKNKSFTLLYSGRNVCTRILNFLYKDADLYLKRKHEKYIEYCISVE